MFSIIKAFDRQKIKQIVVSLLLGMLGALIIQLLFMHIETKIVTVDITGMVKSFENEILKKHLTAEAVSQSVARFGEAMSITLDQYASAHHVIIMPREVVIAGAMDRTDDVKHKIKQRLKP